MDWRVIDVAKGQRFCLVVFARRGQRKLSGLESKVDDKCVAGLTT